MPSDTHQAASHLFREPLIREDTMRGAVTQALQRHLTQHAENQMKAAAHLQLEAVRRAAAQMAHRKRFLWRYTEHLKGPTARGHMMRLILKPVRLPHDRLRHRPRNGQRRV